VQLEIKGLTNLCRISGVFRTAIGEQKQNELLVLSTQLAANDVRQLFALHGFEGSAHGMDVSGVGGSKHRVEEVLVATHTILQTMSKIY
jgi:hypothetical protein